jgi:hypothetical protein
MAFLDNSGDIILDAVLTELGRKKMAAGNFRISKFALGDDEINYELYNKNHASGSAYYDLEIMQTPIFESNTGQNASINYGLQSITNRRLFYMPAIKRNTIIDRAMLPVTNIFYLAISDGVTYDALVTAFGGVAGGGQRKVLLSGKKDSSAIILETGIDNSEIAGTAANRTNIVVSNGLTESHFDVSIDTRFLAGVMGPAGATSFSNNGPSGDSQISITLSTRTPTRKDQSITNHSIVRVASITNNVVKRETDQKADTATSVIAGPRASMTALSFVVNSLAPDDFSRYGKTGQTISGASGTYKYIDTMVKVVGSTGLVEQLPIRIIQKE